MITEIVIGKRYKAKDHDHFRTPLMVYDDCVFYKYEGAGSGCCYDSIESFKKMVEEIPEAPEEWFKVFYTKAWIIGVAVFILLIWIGISAAIRIEVSEFKRLHDEAHKKEKLK